MSLQAARAHGQRRQVPIIGDDHQHIDVLRIGLGRHDRTHAGHSSNPSKLSGGRHDPAQPVEKLLTVALRFGSHDRSLQSSGGTSPNGTRTSIDRGRPGVRLIKPRRSSVMIIVCTDGGVTSTMNAKYWPCDFVKLYSDNWFVRRY